MFEFIKKISPKTNNQLFQDEPKHRLNQRDGRTICSSVKSKRKLIKKQRIAGLINTLREQIEKKLSKVEQKFDSLILEQSSSQQSQGKISMDDWKQQNDNGNIQKMSIVGGTSQMASRKHSLARRKPNQLTDEELPQVSKIKSKQNECKSKVDA